MDEPKVSVIVTACNREHQLAESVGMLLECPGHEDIEIILVDDGSDDETRAVMQRYAAQHPRVKVLGEERMTGGPARNLGLSAAQGKYVMFLNGEQHYAEHLIQRCLERAEATNADVVVFDAGTFDTRSGDINYDRHYLKRNIYYSYDLGDVFCAEDLPDDILRFIPPATWLKFYRRQFLVDEGLEFRNAIWSYDWCFGHLSLCCARRISVIDEQLVFHRTNDARSLPVESDERAHSIIGAIEDLYAGLKERNLTGRLERGFSCAALSALRYNFNNLRCDERDAFIDTLEGMSDDLRSILNHDEDWYTSSLMYRYAYGTVSAMRERSHWRSIQQAKEADLVAQATVDNPVVSVVVPVYNAQDYILETIESVLGQTAKNVEVVCVDDGSSDDSLRIIEEKAVLSNQITVLKQENQGPSVARNTALAHARGTYLMFLDSDDVLREDAVEKLSNKAMGASLDALYFNAEPFFESGFEGGETFHSYYKRVGSYPEVYDGAEFFVKTSQRGDYRPTGCLQMVRAAFVRESGISFCKGILHEDNPFTFQVLMRARRVGYCEDALYLRRVRPNSIMTSGTSFSHAFGYYMAQKLIRAEIEANRHRLDDLSYELMSKHASAILRNARAKYLEMPVEQRGSEYGTGPYYDDFNEIVAKVCRLQESEKLKREEIARLKSEKADLEGQLGSKAYKMGMLLVAPYRRVVDTMRSLKGKLSR